MSTTLKVRSGMVHVRGLGIAVRKLLAESGLSKQDVAAQCEISLTTLSRWEGERNGKFLYRAKSVRRRAKIHGYSLQPFIALYEKTFGQSPNLMIQ